MDTSTVLATIIALASSLTVMGLTMKQNIALTKENTWLRNRNKEMRKQMENMTEVPF